MARIVDEGFLLQPAGVDPLTSEPYKPTWVSRNECSEDLIGRWQDTKHCSAGVVPMRGASVDGFPKSVQDCSVKSEPASAAVHPQRALLLTREECPEIGEITDKHHACFADNTPQLTGTNDIPLGRKRRYGNMTPGEPRYIDHKQRNDQYRIAAKKPRIVTPDPNDCRNEATFENQNNVPILDWGASSPQPSLFSWSSMQSTLVQQLEPPRAFKDDPEPTHWLLDNFQPRCWLGVLAIITGTLKNVIAWKNGEHEGETVVIMSVLNARNKVSASTALVRVLDVQDEELFVRNPIQHITVPVEYLQPVRPTKMKQEALILRGEKKGEIAKVREDCGNGIWFVSVQCEHFEIEEIKLARMLPNLAEHEHDSGIVVDGDP